jgi:hypothetical protein
MADECPARRVTRGSRRPPSPSLFPLAPLKLARCPTRSLLLSQLYLDHSHCLVLAPATLAALPSTRAIPDRDVFYVADPSAPLPGRDKRASIKLYGAQLR